MTREAWLVVAVSGGLALLFGPALVRRWLARPVPKLPAGEPPTSVAPVGPGRGFIAIGFRKRRVLPFILLIGPMAAFLAVLLGYLAVRPIDATTEALMFLLFGPLVAFLGSWVTTLSYRLLFRRPAFVIDELGIVDSSKGGVSRRIFWREIDRLRWVMARPPGLAVELSRPDEYLARQTGWRRLLELLAWKLYRHQVTINTAALAISHDELGKLLVKHVLIVTFDGTPWSVPD